MLQGFLVAALVKVEVDQERVPLAEIRLELQTSFQPALGLPRIAQRIIDAADGPGRDGAGGVELKSSEAPGEGLVQPSQVPK